MPPQPRKRTAAKKTAAKKTAAKKTTAKKAAAPRRAVPDYKGPSFPLDSDGYLSTSSMPGNSTSRGGVVVQVSRALGLRPRPVYDDEVREAVMAFQREHGLEVTGVVARNDWETLFSAPASGGVDGAKEQDSPVGELDAPEGAE